ARTASTSSAASCPWQHQDPREVSASDAQRLRAAGDPAETPTFWVKMRRGSHLACSSLRWPSVGSGNASVRLAGEWSLSKLGYSLSRSLWTGVQVVLSIAPCAAAAIEKFWCRWA